MAAIAPNPEEAANVATEFIYGIDNLPNEVSHILQEIKHRDVRTAELQNEIDREAARYIRHSRRGSTSMPMSASQAASSNTTPVPDSPISASRGDPPTPLPIPQKIRLSYAEIHTLSSEKVALAQRLIDLINHARAKLDDDITRVRLLQGEPPELVEAQAKASKDMKPAGMMNMVLSAGIGGFGAASSSGPPSTGGAELFGAPGRNPALAISESLRNALGQGASNGAAAAASPSASPTGHATKRRRMTTTTSIKISPSISATPTKAGRRSSSPATAAPPAAHTQTKSRLSRQVHLPQESEDDDMDREGEDDDAEGEADADGDADEDGEDDEDQTLYCFCQKQSYGDMIACDNEGDCPYEWFHLNCVGLKQPPAEKWFCSVCAKTKGLTTTGTTTTGRKGRKKS